MTLPILSKEGGNRRQQAAEGNVCRAAHYAAAAGSAAGPPLTHHPPTHHHPRLPSLVAAATMCSPCSTWTSRRCTARGARWEGAASRREGCLSVCRPPLSLPPEDLLSRLHLHAAVRSPHRPPPPRVRAARRTLAWCTFPGASGTCGGATRRCSARSRRTLRRRGRWQPAGPRTAATRREIMVRATRGLGGGRAWRE